MMLERLFAKLRRRVDFTKIYQQFVLNVQIGQIKARPTWGIVLLGFYYGQNIVERKMIDFIYSKPASPCPNHPREKFNQPASTTLRSGIIHKLIIESSGCECFIIIMSIIQIIQSYINNQIRQSPNQQIKQIRYKLLRMLKPPRRKLKLQVASHRTLSSAREDSLRGRQYCSIEVDRLHCASARCHEVQAQGNKDQKAAHRYGSMGPGNKYQPYLKSVRNNGKGIARSHRDLNKLTIRPQPARDPTAGKPGPKRRLLTESAPQAQYTELSTILHLPDDPSASPSILKQLTQLDHLLRPASMSMQPVPAHSHRYRKLARNNSRKQNVQKAGKSKHMQSLPTLDSMEREGYRGIARSIGKMRAKFPVGFFQAVWGQA